ncbi:MAG: hypothetical protein ACI8ZM_005663 [Crocinitomix sp.]|jgi:hypothetical protein
MPFNKKEQHNIIEIRPRFRLITTYSIPEVMALLENSVNQDDSVVGKQVHDIFYLDVPLKERHYWSPELRVSLEQNEAGEGTFIRCVLGPRHSVWLLFIFIYGFLGVISLFGGMYGLAQWNLGDGSSWLWCFPIAFILILSVYITAKLGQRTGRDQMLHLISVLYHSLGDHITERK